MKIKLKIVITILSIYSFSISFGQHYNLLLESIKKFDNNKLTWLVKNGADINEPDINGATPIMWAVYSENIEAVKFLHKQGVSLKPKGVIFLNEEKNGYYGNLTGIAAAKGNLPLLQYLVEQCQLDPDEKEYNHQSKEFDGWSPIEWAMSTEKQDIILYLLKKGADGNKKTETGDHFIFKSIDNKFDSVSILLLQKYSLKNITDKEGNTLLHKAVITENNYLTQLLLGLGASPLIKNKAGLTALDLTYCTRLYSLYQKVNSFASPGVAEKTKQEYFETKPDCNGWTYSAFNRDMLYKLRDTWDLAPDLLKLSENGVLNMKANRAITQLLRAMANWVGKPDILNNLIGNILSGKPREFNMSYQRDTASDKVVYIDCISNCLIAGFENGQFVSIDLKTLTINNQINLKTAITSTSALDKVNFISLTQTGLLVRWNFKNEIDSITTASSKPFSHFFIRKSENGSDIICNNGFVYKLSASGKLITKDFIPGFLNDKLLGPVFTADALVVKNQHELHTVLLQEPLIKLKSDEIIDDLYYSDDLRYYGLCAHTDTAWVFALFDLSSRKIIRQIYFKNKIKTVKIYSDGFYIGLANGEVTNAKISGDEAETSRPHKNTVRNICRVNDFIFVSADNSGELQFINKFNEQIISAVFFTADDYLFIKDKSDGTYYYSGPPQTMNKIHFNDNGSIYSFEQFDLFFNNPPEIVKSIRTSDVPSLKLLEKILDKRRKSAGVTTGDLQKKYNAPQIKTLSIDSSTAKSGRYITLHFTAECEDGLKQTKLKINGTTLVSSLSGAMSADEKLKVYLTSGENIIKFSVESKKTVQSPYKTFKFTIAGTTNSKTYFIGIGANEFSDNKMNLSYAAKDIRDLTNMFRSKYQNNLIVDTFLNKDATKEKILALKQKLSFTTIEDRVIIAISSHGLVDESLDFYLATHDIDFQKPAGRGLKYEEIESLFDNIPARKKLLLIDACHSGLIDKETEAENANTLEKLTENVIAKNTKGLIIGSSKTIGLQNSITLMQNLFADITDGNGAIVISAAGGMEYAFENDQFANGVFTYSILRGLKNRLADIDNNNSITVNELKNYISEEVSRLTKSNQKPSCRKQNNESDWVIW